MFRLIKTQMKIMLNQKGAKIAFYSMMVAVFINYFNNIRIYRNIENFTFQALAARCCITQETLATLNQIDNGQQDIKNKELILPVVNGIFIPSQKYSGKNKYDYKIVTEKDKQDTVFSNKNLSIEAKYWDYTPILMADLEGIIHNMELFESMEDYNNKEA